MTCPCCCKCQDGQQLDPSGEYNIPATVCTSNESVCVEYTYSGADCNQSLVGTSFYSQSGIEYKPCAANTPIGVRAFPCSGTPRDAFDITGKPVCSTVTYDSSCNCVASNCDWVDVVASWANLFGGDGQCDCVLQLIGYTIKQVTDPCP